MGQFLPANCRNGLNDTVKVGDFAFGGVVFSVDKSRHHGLVCAKIDQARGILWSDGLTKTSDVEVIAKTTSTLNKLPVDNSVGVNGQSENTALKVCADYSISVDGILYNDWYLPSKEEVYQMFEKMSIIDETAINNGGTSFIQNNELSPTEFCNSPAWDQVFNYGYRDYEYKNSRFNVRAVRAF